MIPPETSLSGAQVVAERMRQAIEALGIAHPTNPNKRITASFGVASGIACRKPIPKQLFKAADLALYEAKSAGRNRTCLAQATGNVGRLSRTRARHHEQVPAEDPSSLTTMT